MSKNNQSGAPTSGRYVKGRGEGPSADNGYTDSRSDYQIVKDGGWKSKYHMMQTYDLSVYRDGDKKVADQIIEGFRKIDMYQAREEASGHQGGATGNHGYDGQDAYVAAQGRDGGSQDTRHPYGRFQYGGNIEYSMMTQSQGRDGGSQDSRHLPGHSQYGGNIQRSMLTERGNGGSQGSRHPYSTSQYGGNNQYAMVAQGRDSGPQQVDEGDNDYNGDDGSATGYYEEDVGHSGYYEGGGNDYDGHYAGDYDGGDYYDGGDDGGDYYDDGDDDDGYY